MCLVNLPPKCFLVAASVIAFPICLEQITWKSPTLRQVLTTGNYLWNSRRTNTVHLYNLSPSIKGFWFKILSPDPGMTRESSLMCDHLDDLSKCSWTLAKPFFEIEHFFVLSSTMPQLKIHTKIPQLIQLINSLPHYVDQNAF